MIGYPVTTPKKVYHRLEEVMPDEQTNTPTYPCPVCESDNTQVTYMTNMVTDLECLECAHCWEEYK